MYQSYFFFFNDTASTEIYTLSLHDALPISFCGAACVCCCCWRSCSCLSSSKSCSGVLAAGSPCCCKTPEQLFEERSEEHTSELQSHLNLVCRLLLEKKKITAHIISHTTHTQ